MSRLVIANAQWSDAGGYAVQVANAFGSDSSSNKYEIRAGRFRETVPGPAKAG